MFVQHNHDVKEKSFKKCACETTVSDKILKHCDKSGVYAQTNQIYYTRNEKTTIIHDNKIVVLSLYLIAEVTFLCSFLIQGKSENQQRLLHV